MGWIVAVVVFLVLVPLAAWLGRSRGKRVKGGLGLALLHFGVIFDPPRRNDLEIHKREEKESPAPGDPKDPEGADATSGS
jgi:hypothetical protein